MFSRSKKGQLILEVLFTVAVAGAVVGLTAGIILVSLRGNQISLERDVASSLLEESSDALKSVAFENWLSLYNPPDNTNASPAKGSTNCAPPTTLTSCYYVYQSDPTNASSLESKGSAFATACEAGDSNGTLNGTSASSLRNIWVVGVKSNSNAVACKWDGQSWIDYSSSVAAGTTFNDVGTVSLSEIWMAGNGGRLYKFDGTSLTSKTSGFGSNNIYGISTVSGTNSWIVGQGGTVKCSTDSATWNSCGTVGTSSDLYGVSAVTDDTDNNYAKGLVVGAAGTVKTFVQTSTSPSYTWTNQSGGWGATAMRGASVVSINDMWIAGDNGNVWYKCPSTSTNANLTCDSTWHQVDGSGKWGTANIKRINAFNDNLVYITGIDALGNGMVWRYDGTNWTQIGTGQFGANTMKAVSDRFSTDVWFVGTGNNVWQYTPVNWRVGLASVVSGTPNYQIVEDGITYKRYFYIQGVCRDASNNITGISDKVGGGTADGSDVTCNSSTGSLDPSTLEITSFLTWANGSLSSKDFETRWKNLSCVQNAWGTQVATDPADNTNTNVQNCGSSAYHTVTVNSTTGSGDSMSRFANALQIISTEQTQGTLESGVFDLTILPYNKAAANKSDGTCCLPTRTAQIQSLMWTGTLNTNNYVQFKIAASNCPNGATDDGSCGTGVGSWSYVNVGSGSAGTPLNTANLLDTATFSNKRYFRYKVTLCYNGSSGTCAVKTTETTPIVSNVIVNFKP